MTNIVMLIQNRYTLTKQALESLFKHTKCNDYTLTLVDDGSSDFRVQRLLVECIHSGVSVLSVSNSGHRLGQVKNLGAAWSVAHFGKGDYLYFSDNDVYFKMGWLEDITSIYQRVQGSNYMVVGGQAHPYHKPIDSYLDRIGQLILTGHDCIAGVSMLMSWPTWVMSGGFKNDTAPGVCQSEDYAFTEEIKKHGGRLGVTYPHVVIHTGVTNSDGKPAVGSELFPRVPGVTYE